MDPKRDPARRCLKVEDWPVADRALWARALAGADPLDDPGPAAHWSPDTVHKNRRGYGRWLTFLATVAGSLEGSAPAARATREAVAAYVLELRRTVAPITVALRIEDPNHRPRVARDVDYSMFGDRDEPFGGRMARGVDYGVFSGRWK